MRGARQGSVPILRGELLFRVLSGKVRRAAVVRGEFRALSGSDDCVFE